MAEPSSKGPRCPICAKPSVPETRPFCSRRCAEVDLGRWLKGVYRVPTEEAPGSTPGSTPGPNGTAGPHPDEDDA